ncbi:hypothetical protein G6655_05830 [Polynucleobacter paneuropaeus]|nr:hypothetical protein [Polynucleobacter paneuropaeus]
MKKLNFFIGIFFILISINVAAESFFSGEPDEADLRGAFIRFANQLSAQTRVKWRLDNFQKIDCSKYSPKVYRCTTHFEYRVYWLDVNNPLDIKKGTGADLYTKINGLWTLLDSK